MRIPVLLSLAVAAGACGAQSVARGPLVTESPIVATAWRATAAERAPDTPLSVASQPFAPDDSRLRPSRSEGPEPESRPAASFRSAGLASFRPQPVAGPPVSPPRRSETASAAMPSASASAVVPVSAAFENPLIHGIVAEVSPERVERTVRTLVGFGTRHTLSDTISDVRGVGAARRWLHAEFERISAECGGCLEVQYVSSIVPGGSRDRVPVDVRVVNPIAIQRGRLHPDHYVLMTAHYDSRVSDPNNATSDAPGANDNASGVAGLMEVARLLSRHPTDISIVYAPLAGEEQGLFGGSILADHARDAGWNVQGVLNNDVIGNTRGISGIVENTTVRVFAPGIRADAGRAELQRYLSSGGELDVPSRQLARRVVRVAETYLPTLDVLLIYRLDRFSRGGDHTPFFNAGFPAIRITETHEDYRRQHQDVRVEEDVEYGDVPDVMDFEYLSRVAALNAASIASIAWAPPAPTGVRVDGAVSASTTLRWNPVDSPDLAGYRVYWRRPTDAQWTHSRWVGDVPSATLENVLIDNFFFGVAAVDESGNESLIVFPGA